MTNILIHRGPESDGFWTFGNIGMGHRRLAIIDLSENGQQPMHYSERYVITFNGEIYNYIELKKELINKGYSFKTKSDTEVIMASYDYWGVECLSHFDGMFAFGLYDLQTKELFCARDRFGEKPFFFSFNKEKLLFASEMKALWAAGIDKTINDKMVYLFLNYSLHENPADISQTFFRSIFKLKPGHYFKINVNQQVEQKCYWKIDINKKNDTISFDSACEQFKDLFFTSVTRRLRSDVVVGTSLSGGLDSSSVVLVIDNILKKSIAYQKTFSARFNDTKLDEGYYMSKVIEGKKIQHFCTWPDSKMLMSELPLIMYHQEEPFASASIFAQWEVFKLARQENVIVLLDGQGADEYLSGYTHFFIPYLREKYKSGGRSFLLSALNQLNENNIFDENLNLGLKFKMETSFPSIFNNLRRIKHRILGTSSDKIISSNLKNVYHKQPVPFENFSSLNKALYHYTLISGLEKLLRFADRNSMAFSREVRLPFLNHELVEFVFSLPSSYKIHEGWTKAVLRFGLKDTLTPEITWRKNKLGFQPPQTEWESSKEWINWSNDFHNISIKNKWIKKDTKPTWKSVNLGLFEDIQQKN